MTHHGVLLIFKDKDFRKMFDITDWEVKMQYENQPQFIDWLYRQMPQLQKKLSKIERFKSFLKIKYSKGFSRILENLHYWKSLRPFVFIDGADTYLDPHSWIPLKPKDFLIPKKWLELKNELKEKDFFKELPKESQNHFIDRIDYQFYGGVYQKKNIDFEFLNQEMRKDLEKEIAFEKQYPFLSFNVEMPQEREIVFIRPAWIVLDCKKLIDVFEQLKEDKTDYYRPYYEIYDKYIRNLDDNDWLMTADYNN